MGVQGLTTFINSNSEICFHEYNLHNCTIVVDGNSLAAVLYCNTLGPYSAFGGDYDYFTDQVESFIRNLRKCKIDAIFIFDGGYELKKSKTVRKRNAMKVFISNKVVPVRPSRDFFPLMIRPVLQEKLLELGVICLQSDHEADVDIAAIAKHLNCPVLSNDSDFFIFDVLYIPLSMFPLDVYITSKDLDNPYCYIPCQIFYLENFLKTFGGLDKSMLPLLATVLGNDYLNRSTFKNFYNLIKLDKNKKKRLGQRRVGGLVKWMKNETFDSALQKILCSLQKSQRERVKKFINTIVNCYTNVSTCLIPYIPKDILETDGDICSQLKDMKITEIDDINNDTSDEESEIEPDFDDNNQVECEDYDERFMDDDIGSDRRIPLETDDNLDWLYERSRQCQISPQVITLLTLATYFSVPQVEDCVQEHSGEIGIPILQYLTGVIGPRPITYWYRHRLAYHSRVITPLFINRDDTVIDLSNINQFGYEERKAILLEIMGIQDADILKEFPENWQLLIACLMYWIKHKVQLKSYHIHAVILMIITVNIYKSNIGSFRTEKQFKKKYNNKLKNLMKERELIIARYDENRNKTMIEEFIKITNDDCIITFENILPHFSIDISLKQRPRLFSRARLHFYAELQSILDLTQSLNGVLLLPYKRIQISKFYNGTFLYNVTTLLKRQSDVITCLENLYMKAPNMLHLHMSIYYTLVKFMINPEQSKRVLQGKRKKNRRQQVNRRDSAEERESSESNEENVNEAFYDENNKFTLLQKE